MVNHRFKPSDVIFTSFKLRQARHHAHHSGWIHRHIAHRVITHSAHWRHRNRGIRDAVPALQPALHHFNFGCLCINDGLTESEYSTVRSACQAIICHVECHLMMVNHPFHKAHFGTSSASFDGCVGEHN